MKVYVASSWRNVTQPHVVATLRSHGHEVYDFKNPESAFSWESIDAKYKQWQPVDLRMHLEDPLAEKGFASDMGALKWCDAVVLVLPCGKSAHLEMGWAAGANKKTILFARRDQPMEPELMYKMFDHFCVSMGEVLAALNDV
jgi:hypothetical protein